MATPYLQFRRQTVSSTQDLARDIFDRLPVLVSATDQTAGRGRTGSSWASATSAAAVSYARRIDGEVRPLSLMAGLAAVRAIEPYAPARLKWPNDLMLRGDKVGGILVEIAAGVAVVGLGLNLHWPDRPHGTAHLFDVAPPDGLSFEVAALWAAELNRYWDGAGWDRERYIELCETVGRSVVWDGGEGRAVDVDSSGALVVETDEGVVRLVSGSVRHVRSA